MPRRTSLPKKIKILKQIKNRVPVCCNIRDPNRALMIKFKYGTITESEFQTFHENIKKLIYKAMHSRMVVMDWDDIYQEVWQKIIRSKHTWNESKGTYVSTWVTIVTFSVLSTLRQNAIKHNSRFCLYEDLKASVEKGEDNPELNDILLYHKGDETFLEKIGGRISTTMWNVDFQAFMKELTMAEKTVIKAAFELEKEFIRAYEGNGKRPLAELREKTGYDETTIATLLNNIKKKYESAFSTKINAVNDDNCKIEKDSNNETLF